METMVNLKNNEDGILDGARVAFKRETGAMLTVKTRKTKLQRGMNADAEIVLTIAKKSYTFLAEVKKFLNTQTIGAVMGRLKRLGKNAILIAEYVNPKMADRLKENHLPFIDTAGNAYLNIPPVLIWVTGRQVDPLDKRKTATRAFTQTGLKVIFAILCNKNLINAPYRDIAKIANVALGTVGWVFADLRENRFLLDIKKGKRKLKEKEKLFNRWVEGYGENLKPKLLVGRYNAVNNDWWKTLDTEAEAFLWGGEVAAGILTNYLAPENLTIYKEEAIGNFVVRNNLQKALDGRIEILRLFWLETDYAPDRGTVHPFIIYADLVTTGEPRNMEVAERIYNEQVVQFIR